MKIADSMSRTHFIAFFVGAAITLALIVLFFALFGLLESAPMESAPNENAALAAALDLEGKERRIGPTVEAKELDLEPNPDWRAGDPEPPDTSVFEAQLDCLEQATGTAYRPAAIVDPVPLRGPDLLRVRARFSYFEGRLDLPHPRNYSDHSRLARIAGAAERHGYGVAACLQDSG